MLFLVLGAKVDLRGSIHLGGASGYMPHGRGWCDVRFTKSRGEVDINKSDLTFFISKARLTRSEEHTSELQSH